MKPRVMSLVIFTCAVGLLTSQTTIPLFDSLISIFFVTIGAGAAGALNMWYEADLDKLMTRTCLRPIPTGKINSCLLYTSDAADEEDSVDLGGRRIIKKNVIGSIVREFVAMVQPITGGKAPEAPPITMF